MILICFTLSFALYILLLWEDSLKANELSNYFKKLIGILIMVLEKRVYSLGSDCTSPTIVSISYQIRRNDLDSQLMWVSWQELTL